MAFRYRLLSNQKGVLTERGVQTASGELALIFEDCPANATAVVESNGKECYRKISVAGECTVPADFLGDDISVSVAVLDGSARPLKWTCEGLRADRHANGCLFVRPDDNDLPQKVADLYAENNELKKTLAMLDQKLNELTKQIQTMLEGYDLV